MRLPCTLAFAFLASTLHAQISVAVTAPKPLLESLNLWDGTVQHLPLPMTAEGAFTVDVMLGEHRRTLQLQPLDIYAPGSALIAIDDDGKITQSPLPPANTLQGAVAGVPGSWVAASLYNGQLTAIISMPDAGWSIDPASDGIAALPLSAHVVYRHDQMRAIPDACQVVEPILRPMDLEPKPILGSTANAAAKRLGYTPELTAAYISAVGGTTNAINRVSQIANGLDSIYTNETVFTSVRLVRILTTPNNLSTNAGTALNQLRNRWLDRFELNFASDVAQGFTNVLSGNTIGIAYLRGACTGNRVSVVQNYGNVTQRTGLSAHEAGHLLGANHCTGSGCFIMCSTLGGCGRNMTRFGTGSRNAINNFVNPRTCFDN